jgi:hypothetical protein
MARNADSMALSGLTHPTRRALKTSAGGFEMARSTGGRPNRQSQVVLEFDLWLTSEKSPSPNPLIPLAEP